MALNRNDPETIRRYLLGQLAEENVQEIEQRLLAEDDLFQELEVAEDELVDEYVAGELTPPDRAAFEGYFLSIPERAQNLTFARALLTHVSKKTALEAARPQPVSPAGLSWFEGLSLAWTRQTLMLRIATIAVAILVVAGSFVLIRSNLYSSRSYATVALSLSANNRASGGQATKVKLPLGADVLRLYLNLPEASSQANTYRVELLQENGETRNIEKVTQEGKSIVIEIPASQLAAGQYAFRVSVIKPDGKTERLGGSYLLTAE
jgi:hypothetical protein